MEWLEVRIIANKTVVQKNGVETLHDNRNALEKKKTFAIFAAGWTDATAKACMRKSTACRYYIIIINDFQVDWLIDCLTIDCTSTEKGQIVVTAEEGFSSQRLTVEPWKHADCWMLTVHVTPPVGGATIHSPWWVQSKSRSLDNVI